MRPRLLFLLLALFIAIAIALVALLGPRGGLFFFLPVPFIFVGRGPKAVAIALVVFAAVFLLALLFALGLLM
jgi:hypothetical protein